MEEKIKELFEGFDNTLNVKLDVYGECFYLSIEDDDNNTICIVNGCIRFNNWEIVMGEDYSHICWYELSLFNFISDNYYEIQSIIKDGRTGK